MGRRDRTDGGDPGVFDEQDTGAVAVDGRARPVREFGPFDVAELDPGDPASAELVDFGAIRLPVPADGAVSVESGPSGSLQAVHVMLPQGRLTMSALAAPRSTRLWPELAREIEQSLRDGGVRPRSFTGEWGRELRARSAGAASVFVGVDGERWMLYGVATGADEDADALDTELRRMLKGTVVIRGRLPYPPRTVLPLTLPEHLRVEQQAPVADAPTQQAPAADAPTQQSPLPDPEPPTRHSRVPDPEPPTRQPPALADPPTVPIPPPRVGPTDDQTDPLGLLVGVSAAPVGRRGRHARGEAEDVAEQQVRGGPHDQPALAFLMDDPMVLFDPARRTGRHRRPD